MGHNISDIYKRRRDFLPTPLPDEALEVFADVLLLALGKDPQIPAYSEPQLSDKQRYIRNAETYFCDLFLQVGTVSGFDLDVFAKEMHLTERERLVLELSAEGYHVIEIADKMKLNYRTIRRILDRLAGCASDKTDAYTGVYHTEVHKKVYRKPTHCTTQPCKKLGYCKYTNWGKAASELE